MSGTLLARYDRAMKELIETRAQALWQHPPDTEADRWKQTGYLQGLNDALEILQSEAAKMRRHERNA